MKKQIMLIFDIVIILGIIFIIYYKFKYNGFNLFYNIMSAIIAILLAINITLKLKYKKQIKRVK